MCRLLLLLDEVADAAAAGRRDIDEARALEVVPVADLGALHRHGNPVEAEAASTAEEKALDGKSVRGFLRDDMPPGESCCLPRC